MDETVSVMRESENVRICDAVCRQSVGLRNIGLMLGNVSPQKKA